MLTLSKYKFSNLDVFLIALFIVLFVLLRWNSINTPFERDEGEYAYSAWILRQGVMPYENSFMQKPPMIVYTYALGQMFDNGGVVSPRILSGLFILGTTILLGLIARKLFGKKVGFITIFLVTAMLLLPVNAPFAANTENFMLLPLTGLLWIYVFKSKSQRLKYWFLGGVFSSLAFLYKPIVTPVIIYIYCFWIYKIYKNKKEISMVVTRLALSFFSFILTSIIVFSPFILTRTFDKVLESAFIYNLSYTSFEGFGIANFFNYFGGRYIKFYWPLYILLVLFIVKKPKGWLFWLGLFLTSLLSVYSSPMGHYYILIMPFWALLASKGVLLLSKEKYLKDKLGNTGWLKITLVILFIIIFPFREQFTKTSDGFNVWIYGRVNPFVEAVVAGEKVKEATSPDDKIFVAGSEPEIYYYSQRKSTTRFVITYPLNITSTYQEKYQKELVDNLKKDPPKAIVVSNLQHSGLWNEGSPRIFIDYLEEIITDKYQVKGAWVYGANDSWWLTELSNEDINSSSLVLYVRK